MGALEHDYDLLLSAPVPVDAALARDLLAEQGIPLFEISRSRLLAHLGPGHESFARPDLFVPKGMREKARAILDEAWGAAPPVDAGDAHQAIAAIPARSRSREHGARRWPLIVFALLMLLAALRWLLP